jgi:hypothetical protein
MFIVQLGSIELLNVNAQVLHKVKITKQKPIKGFCNWCLPCSREGGLVFGKLRVGCPPNAPCSSSVLEHIWYVMHEY